MNMYIAMRKEIIFRAILFKVPILGVSIRCFLRNLQPEWGKNVTKMSFIHETPGIRTFKSISFFDLCIYT